MSILAPRLVEESLLACALYAPHLLPHVRLEFNLEPPADPHIATLWRALVATDAAHGRTSALRVAEFVAGDAGASAALCGLPDTGPFDQMLEAAMRSRTATRSARRATPGNGA